MRLVPLAASLVFVSAACDRGLDDDTPRDAKGPRIEVSEPARGLMLEGATQVTVKGRVTDDEGVDVVTVNGAPARLDASGHFSIDVPLEAGMTLIQVNARDEGGNEEKDTRAVIAGTLVPLDSTVSHAFKVRIDADALRVGGIIAANALEEKDLTALLSEMNPLFAEGNECQAIRVDFARLAKGEITMDVRPLPSGLEVRAMVKDVDFAMNVRYKLACDPLVEELRARASEFHLSGILGVGLVDGKVALTVEAPQASFVGLEVDQNVLPPEIVQVIQGPAGVFLSQALAVALSKEIPRLLGRFIGERGVEQTVTVLGKTVAFGLQPTELLLDDTGLTVALDSRFSIPGEDYGYRFMASPDAPPEMDGALPVGGVSFAVADDAINQVLAAMWAAGVIDQDIDLKAGNYAGLGVLFDKVELRLALPPMVVARAAGGGADIKVGDLTCTFYKDNRVVTQLALSAEMNVKLQISSDNRFHLVAESPLAWIDVLHNNVDGANPLANADFEELGSFAVTQLASVVTGLIENVPVPVFYGATVTGGVVTTGGPRGGYLLGSGRLVEAP